MDERLELISDSRGAIVLGWLTPTVWYMKLFESVSSGLGLKCAFRIERTLSQRSGICCYADAFELETVDDAATPVLRRAFMSHRTRIESFVVLAQTPAVLLSGRTFAVMMGNKNVVVLEERSAFDSKLTKAAPGCHKQLDPRTWVSVRPKARNSGLGGG